MPEVRQGYWKHIHTVVKSKEEIHTHQWTDIIRRETTYIPRQRTLFQDWLLPQDILDQREQVRAQLSKEGYQQKVETLQKQCLIKYSSTWHRPIDSIELEITEDRLNLITNRIVQDDNRGVPLRLGNLKPYDTKELEGFIRPHYLTWLRAGGLERYIQGERTFWIDLWDIIEGEEDKQITWYLPEVNSENKKEQEELEEKGKTNQKEEGLHQSHHSSDLYHQGMHLGTAKLKELMQQRPTKTLSARQEMPTRRVKIHR